MRVDSLDRRKDDEGTSWLSAARLGWPAMGQLEVTTSKEADRKENATMNNANSEVSHVGYVADRSHPIVVRRQGKREYFQIAPGG